jgi:hypothetical protein
MLRIIAAIAGGLIVWFVVATIGNLGVRLSWPDYIAVEKSMNFTLAMQITRLALGALASLAAGAAAAWIAHGSGVAVKGAGILLTALFIPIHYNLWDKFPAWYHAAFLISLFPLTMLGAFLFVRGTGARA